MYFKYSEFLELTKQRGTHLASELLEELRRKDYVLRKEIAQVLPGFGSYKLYRTKKLAHLKLTYPRGIYPAAIVPTGHYLQIIKLRENDPQYEKNKKIIVNALNINNGFPKKIMVDLLNKTLLLQPQISVRKKSKMIKLVHNIFRNNDEVLNSDTVSKKLNFIRRKKQDLELMEETLEILLKILSGSNNESCSVKDSLINKAEALTEKTAV